MDALVAERVQQVDKMTIPVLSKIPATTLSPTSISDFLRGDGTFAPLFTQSLINDASPTITGTDNQYITYNSLTASRTVTLPSASSAGQMLILSDGAGTCSSTNTIIIARSGSDVINYNSTSLVLNYAYAAILLISTGTGRWKLIGSALEVNSPTINLSTLNHQGPVYYNCGNGCSWTCYQSCTSSCSSCTATCANQCITCTSCTGGCTSGCISCTGGCTSGCIGCTGCSGSCSGGCTGCGGCGSK